MTSQYDEMQYREDAAKTFFMGKIVWLGLKTILENQAHQVKIKGKKGSEK